MSGLVGILLKESKFQCPIITFKLVILSPTRLFDIRHLLRTRVFVSLRFFSILALKAEDKAVEFPD